MAVVPLLRNMSKETDLEGISTLSTVTANKLQSQDLNPGPPVFGA